MTKQKRITYVLISLFIAPLLVWALEFHLADIVGKWRNPANTSARQEAAPWLQDMSREVSAALNVPTLKVYQVPAKGFHAQARLEAEPYSINIGDDLAKNGDRDAIKGIVAHEYGHLVALQTNRSTPHLIYLLIFAPCLFVVLLSSLLLSDEPEVTAFTVFLGVVAGLWFTTNRDAAVTASMTVITLLAGVGFITTKTARAKKQYLASMLLALGLYAAGTEFTVNAFREEEKFADGVAQKVVPDEVMAKMFCSMIAERDKESIGNFMPYVRFQLWQDFHPLAEDRAAARHVSLSCQSKAGL